jgi:acetylornithine deacetylase/succinyl-diaminopimelate desuccinylase-like protein
MLNGGHAENALPQTASALVNCRLLPGTRIDDVRQTLVGVVDNAEVKVSLLQRYPETAASPLRDDVIAVFRQALDVDHPGLPIVPVMAHGASDAMYYRARGIPSYAFLSVFMRPEDDFAHGLDERVPAAGIAPALRFWDALLRAAASR